MCGWQLARSLLAAEQMVQRDEDIAFAHAKIATARFYAEHVLTTVPGQREAIMQGAESTLALAPEQF